MAWLLLLFFVLGVLAPTCAIFWFMNEAARNQAEAAQHRVTEAYSGQLRLLRQRVEDWAAGQPGAISKRVGAGGVADYPTAVRESGADSIILLDGHGAAIYPSLATRILRDPVEADTRWLAAAALEGHGLWDAAAADYSRLADNAADASLSARAAQAQIRCVLRGGRKGEALEAILRRFPARGASQGVDLQGRLIAADEQLLALQLMRRGDHRYQPLVDSLASLLNEYTVAMPSAQRLFLMSELRTLAPEGAVFPTEAAERLALQYLETPSASTVTGAVQATGVADVWRVTAKDGRVLALYRTASLRAAMDHALQQQSSSPGVVFSVTPPGAMPLGEAIAIGPVLPGWLIGFSMDSRATENAAHARVASYIWVGSLVIVALVLMGALLASILRHQFLLAQLKTDLLAAVSHEFRTPLASTRLLIESLQADEQVDEGKTREYLALMADSNQRLSRLVENFLTFSRAEQSREPFVLSPISAGEIVEAVLPAMQQRLQLPLASVEVEVDADLPLLRADKDALVTALLNLLDNAFKYTPCQPRIVLRAYAEESSVVFSVEDNGIGIAPEEQRRIFRRFYRVDQKLAQETSGCGLGLSIVDAIVRTHGGTANLSSEEGRGSTFRIVLPAANHV